MLNCSKCDSVINKCEINCQTCGSNFHVECMSVDGVQNINWEFLMTIIDVDEAYSYFKEKFVCLYNKRMQYNTIYNLIYNTIFLFCRIFNILQ